MEYLVTVRGGQVSQMGYVSAGFGGGGSLLGRFVLPEPTHRFGEKRGWFWCIVGFVWDPNSFFGRKSHQMA